jgi:hypothetical protein
MAGPGTSYDKTEKAKDSGETAAASFALPHLAHLFVTPGFFFPGKWRGVSNLGHLKSGNPRGKRAWGVRATPLKNDPSILASLQVRVPVAPSTQRRKVRALIRSPVLRSDDVVTDEALGLTALRAAVAVSLLHPPCLLLPSALVQRGTDEPDRRMRGW